MTDTTWAAKVAAEVNDRAIARLQALPDHAGRPAWDQIVAEEITAAIPRMGAGDGLVERATAALEGVAPGPWHEETGDVHLGELVIALVEINDIPNARFIAFTRQWVPEAAAHIAALNAKIATMIEADAVQAMLDAAQPIMAEACRGYEEQIAALTAQVAEAERERDVIKDIAQQHILAELAEIDRAEAAEAEAAALRAKVARLEGALALYSCEDGCNDCPQNERDRVSCGWTARAALTNGAADE